MRHSCVRRGRGGTRAGSAAALLLLAPLTMGAGESPDPGASIKSSRETLAKWVETQQIIAKEKKDWLQAKEILTSRISLVQAEIDTVKKTLEETRATGAEGMKKRAEATHDEAAIQEAGTAVAGWTAGLERDLKALLPRLPEPVRTKVEPLASRMPADPDHTSISSAERLQNVVGILNEVGRFNNDITLATEVRTLSDGKPSEVRTIYVGLAQAYYLSAGGEAGVGRPSGEGWTWKKENGLAPAVTRAVEILQAKAKPAFVPLPVTIK